MVGAVAFGSLIGLRVPSLPPDVVALLLASSPEQRAALLNANTAGFDAQIGQRFEFVSAQRTVAVVEIDARHLQPYGLVHGGVYASLVESACSVGCAFGQLGEGLSVVGIENRTRFVRGTRAGVTLRVEALPDDLADPALPVWRAEVKDDEGNMCAHGRLHLAVLDPEISVGGEALASPHFRAPKDN